MLPITRRYTETIDFGDEKILDELNYIFETVREVKHINDILQKVYLI